MVCTVEAAIMLSRGDLGCRCDLSAGLRARYTRNGACIKRATRRSIILAAAVRPLEECKAHDLLKCITAGGSQELFEVIDGWNGGFTTLLWKGQLLKLAAGDGDQAGSLQLTPMGGYPSEGCLTAASFREMARVLPSMHDHAGAPSFAIESAEVVDSLDRLLDQVAEDPSSWRDGIAPGDPARSEYDQALFTAGELAALMAGQRGLVLVQLWNGWDTAKGQPLYNPFALCMLERALAAPGVGWVSSVAPGGVGLTGIVYADREPFASWAAHLAGFGCQANVAAGSSYYKLLIGRLLGYKTENVLAYVAASGVPAPAQLQQQVEDDIRALSKVKPRLPWSPDDAKIKKPTKSAGKPKAGTGFGAAKAGAHR